MPNNGRDMNDLRGCIIIIIVAAAAGCTAVMKRRDGPFGHLLGCGTVGWIMLVFCVGGRCIFIVIRLSNIVAGTIVDDGQET